MANYFIPMEIGISTRSTLPSTRNVRENRLFFGANSIIDRRIFLANSSEIKRKGLGETHDESTMPPIDLTKVQRVEYNGAKGEPLIDEEDNEADRRCVDLIVLGISYRSLEADVKKCFEAFGELVFCEVTNSSRHSSRKRIESAVSDQTRWQWTIAWIRFYSLQKLRISVSGD